MGKETVFGHASYIEKLQRKKATCKVPCVGCREIEVDGLDCEDDF
ncbi:MAG: hypothetical protein ACLFU9_05645 [Candidatus Bathyarchaeia archaeon]